MPPPRMTGTGRPTTLVAIAFLVIYVLLTIAYTWPLAERLDATFVYPGLPSVLGRADLYLTSSILSWIAHQIIRHPLRLFEANFFYPLPRSLAFSEHMLAGALLLLPVDLVHHSPVLEHNVLVLVSFALGATGVALLVHELGGSFVAALAGGALFAFNPLRQAQLGHVQALSTHWMPFTLLFLHRSLRTASWRAGLLFAATLLLQLLSSITYLYYFGLAIVLFLALHAVCRCPAAPGAYRRVFWLGLAVLVAVVPTMLPYVVQRDVFDLAHDPMQSVDFSAVGMHYLAAVLAPADMLQRRFVDGRLLSPMLGMATALLSVWGLWRGGDVEYGGRRLAILYGGLALGLAIVSLGPAMRMQIEPSIGFPGPHAWFARYVPGFDALRVPQRAGAITLLALSVLAGLGADVVVFRRGSRFPRSVGVALLAGLAALDCWRPALSVLPAPADGGVPAVYRWLAAQPGNFAIVELPMKESDQEAAYMLLSGYHWKRLVNGYSGFVPGHAYLIHVLADFPDAASVRLMHALGVRYVVAHVRGGHREARLCERIGARAYLVSRYRDPDACVLEIMGAPALPAQPADRPVSLVSARLSSSARDNPGAVADGNLATHWLQPVTWRAGWLQVDLPAEQQLTRVVLRFARHFGEYPRSYQVAASAYGSRWTTLVDAPVAEPPLAGLLAHPEDLAMEIRLPGSAVRHLRILKPQLTRIDQIPLYLDWHRWGLHELELYERTGS